MEYLPINKHNFELEYNKIKDFTSKRTDIVSLQNVKTHCFFGLFERNVKGNELNDTIVKIQSQFINTNNEIIEIINVFDNIIKLIDYLDSEYIKGILINFDQAAQALEDAKDAQEKLRVTFDALKATVLKLDSFKERLDKIEHLYNIDEIWQLFDYINDNHLISKLNELIDFKNTLEENQHLLDIDVLWENQKDIKEHYDKTLSEIKNGILTLENNYNLNKHSIEVFDSFKTKLEQTKHLLDIDILWENQNGIKEHYDKTLSEIENDIVTLDNNYNLNKHSIEVVDSFKTRLERTKHLYEIDKIWEANELLTEKLQQQNEIIEEDKQELKKLQKSNKLHNIITYSLIGASIIAITINFIL